MNRAFGAAHTDSESARESFFHFAGFPLCRTLERFDRASVIEMQNSVELVGQSRMKIVTASLSFWPVNDTDCAFEPLFAQLRSDIRIVVQVQPEPREIDIVKKFLVTSAQSRTHFLALGWSVPIRSCGDRPCVSCESNQPRFFSKPLPDKLAEI